MPANQHIDEAFDNYKDRHADDHLGMFDDDDDAWARRAPADLIDQELERSNHDQTENQTTTR